MVLSGLASGFAIFFARPDMRVLSLEVERVWKVGPAGGDTLFCDAATPALAPR